MPSVSRQGLIHLGMDVHRDSISVAVLEPDRDAPEVDRIFNDEYAVRRLIARFSDPASGLFRGRPHRLRAAPVAEHPERGM